MVDYGVSVSGLLLPFFIEASDCSYALARRESDLRDVVYLLVCSDGEFETFCGGRDYSELLHDSYDTFEKSGMCPFVASC